MAKPKVTDVAAKIVNLLTPLSSEERQRVIRAALTLVGEEQSVQYSKADVEENRGGGGTAVLPSRARVWAKKNEITMDDLQQVFHIEDGKAEVIASEIPGKGDKGKTHNAYILEGVSRFLSSDDSSFDDKSARALCRNLGVYNAANHASYMKEKGNRLAGSKDGWKLTAPGLAHGAALVKEMSTKK